jgi:hypothetical protein
MITSTMKPTCTGTYFLGEQGERGNSQQTQGFQPFPLIEVLGNRGNTNMFFNIRPAQLPAIWLLPFPQINRGERVPPLRGPETLAVPPFPRSPDFFSQTHLGISENARVTS